MLRQFINIIGLIHNTNKRILVLLYIPNKGHNQAAASRYASDLFTQGNDFNAFNQEQIIRSEDTIKKILHRNLIEQFNVFCLTIVDVDFGFSENSTAKIYWTPVQ